MKKFQVKTPVEKDKLEIPKKKKNRKRIIRMVLAIGFILIGLVFSFFPFIPLGYIFLLAGVLFLSSFIPPLDKFLRKLEEKDRKAIKVARRKSDKIENKINDRINIWSGDKK